MRVQRLIFFICALGLSIFSAGAQNIRRDDPFGGTTSPIMKPNPKSSEYGKTMDAPTSPIAGDKYYDTDLENLEKQIAERNLGTEEGDWAAACKENSYAAYQRYSARYPNGAHAAEAARRMVDLNVNNIFSSAHNAFPQLQRDTIDEESTTCTVTVENHTDYPMTVMFSGATSKSIVIRPESRGSVTLKTGTYRIGASVTKPGVRPFAGTQKLLGGRYHTGFTIVYR